jgi:hypothetical protein
MQRAVPWGRGILGGVLRGYQRIRELAQQVGKKLLRLLRTRKKRPFLMLC